MPARFPVVLVDDGELDDVRDLLLELGAEFAHLRGSAVPKRIEPPSELFVSTVRRAQLARAWPHAPDGSLRPVRIAVTGEDSPAARSQLRRMGFSYLVRPPVHPVALRLLLLRALYRGEERRAEARVPVGVDISLRSGFRRRDGLLADLSRGGCRLLVDRALPAGARVTIHLPEDLVGDGALSLSGQILRCERDARALLEGGFGVAVRFHAPAADDLRRLERLLARRDVSLGPAAEEPCVRPLRPAPPEQPAEAPAPAKPAASSEPKPADSSELKPADSSGLPGGAGSEQKSPAKAPAEPPRLGAALISRSRRRAPPPDRRRHTRALYGRRVIAEASAAMHRMLLGRDVGVGGMRVDAHPDLKLGARLRVAIFDTAREEPVVLDAVVARDDGADGLALHFLEVGPELALRLEALVAALPPVERLTDGESGALGTVVGEIVS